MAIQCNLAVQGGLVASSAYVRIESVSGKKDRSTGTFYATGVVRVYVSAAEAAKDEPVPLVAVHCQAVKKTNVDITTNVLAQLYAKLTLDLAGLGATNIVGV